MTVPALMGIVNATPDSFSDPQGAKESAELVERGLRLVEDGAAIVDVGGESGRTDRPPVSEEEEAARVVPVIEELAGQGVAVSVDTWRAGPARAALEAGATMVNDVSGLSDPRLAELCAERGAALVITHTRAKPKVKDYGDHGDVVEDVIAFLSERIEVAVGAGVEEVVLDPGLDLGKTTSESVAILARLGELEVLGRPLLLAVSRKDFVGAITGRRPGERDAGTLGAIEPLLDLSVGTLLRVHDVAGARDFLAVREALRSPGATVAELRPGLRREAG